MERFHYLNARYLDPHCTNIFSNLRVKMAQAASQPAADSNSELTPTKIQNLLSLSAFRWKNKGPGRKRKLPQLPRQPQQMAEQLLRCQLLEEVLSIFIVVDSLKLLGCLAF